MTTLMVEIAADRTSGKTTLGLCLAIGAAAKKMSVVYVVPTEAAARFFEHEYLKHAGPDLRVMSATRAAMNFPTDATFAVLDDEDRFTTSDEGATRNLILRRLDCHPRAQLVALRGAAKLAG